MTGCYTAGGRERGGQDAGGWLSGPRKKRVPAKMRSLTNHNRNQVSSSNRKSDKVEFMCRGVSVWHR